MKNKSNYLLVLISILLVSCGSSNENTETSNTVAYTPTEQEKTNNTTTTPIENGKKIALETKGILEKNLGNAMANGGPINALEFCSTRAIPLTDSMSIALNASIKRVSDKNRNPLNAANSSELEYINATKKLIELAKEPLPKLVTTETKHIGYYPIITNQKCMKCHGQVDTDIAPETHEAIKNFYPKDLATGYNLGELRGIWVIEMNKK